MADAKQHQDTSAHRALHLQGLRVVVTLWVLCSHFCKSGGFLLHKPSKEDLIPGYNTPSTSEVHQTLDFYMTVLSRGRVVPVKILAVLSGFFMHWRFGGTLFHSLGSTSELLRYLLQYYGRRMDRVLFTFYVTLAVSTFFMYNPLFSGVPKMWALRDDGGGEAGRSAVQADVVWSFTLLRPWVPSGPQAKLGFDRAPIANSPCWFILAALPSWVVYPLLAAPLRMHAGRPSRFLLLFFCALGIAFAQFQLSMRTWEHLCWDLASSGVVAPSDPDAMPKWYAWDPVHYHPLTFFAEFVVGALAAAAAHTPRTDGFTEALIRGKELHAGESQPLMPSRAPFATSSIGSLAVPLTVSVPALASDVTLLVAAGLVLFLPRPHTFGDACPASRVDMGDAGPGTAAYGWDPIIMFASPAICLLVAGYACATMRAKADAECGACAGFLRLFAPFDRLCLSAYLWQVPFAYVFFRGRPVPNELDPLLFGALFLWAYIYTALVETPCVLLLRSACGCRCSFPRWLARRGGASMGGAAPPSAADGQHVEQPEQARQREQLQLQPEASEQAAEAT